MCEFVKFRVAQKSIYSLALTPSVSLSPRLVSFSMACSFFSAAVIMLRATVLPIFLPVQLGCSSMSIYGSLCNLSASFFCNVSGSFCTLESSHCKTSCCGYEFTHKKLRLSCHQRLCNLWSILCQNKSDYTGKDNRYKTYPVHTSVVRHNIYRFLNEKIGHEEHTNRNYDDFD